MKPLRRAPTLNVPNQLTVLRLGMCGLLLISMSFPWPYAATTAFVIFTLASITDWVDGAMARAYNLVTDLGKLLDPLADKILITAALVALVERHVAPMWMVVLIIAREFLITGLRIIAAHKQRILAAERIGKHKTISQIVAILVSLAVLSLGEFGFQNSALTHFLSALQPWLYWFALIITVWSGIVYFWRNAGIVAETMEETSSSEAPVVDKPSTAVSSPAPAIESAKVATPAFKEWEAIVEALGHGAQIVILRKGGIAEGRTGFQAKHPKFWLFPTGFHQQWEKTKPELQRYVTPATATAEKGKDVTLLYIAEVTDTVYLSSWEQVARLDDAHFWGEEIMRERFDYADRPGMEPGLHLLVVRVSRINLPHKLAASSDYDGCKSWIEVPVDWEHDIAVHVVRAEEFSTRRSRILAAVATVSVSSASGTLPKVAPKLTPHTA
jgi:CDP-diacylglycerol---glycerol-3-phosphate 3-phosphatidyltransferase